MAKTPVKNDIDFFEALRLRQRDTRPKGHPVRTAVIVTAAAAALALVGDGVWKLYNENLALDSGIAGMEEVVYDEANIAAAEKTETTMAGAAALEDYNSRCETYRGYLEGTGRLGSEQFEEISALAPAGVTINSYAYADGALTVVCSADSKDGPARYAESLTKSEKFLSVDYAGFTTAEKDGAVIYSFTLTCLYAGMD